MTVIDDKTIRLRLASRPEFILRLSEFLCAYDIGEKPALVIQARPAPGNANTSLNVDNPTIQKSFLAGVQTQDSWWQGFRAMATVRPTFHGVASLPSTENPAWASEMHRDGHFIAGVWKFPEMPAPQGGSVSAIFDFYARIFQDFFAVISASVKSRNQPDTYEASATLVGASQLYFANLSDFGRQYVLRSDPLFIQNLQWMIWTAAVGSPEWDVAAIEMGRALVGAYGAFLPES